MKIRNLTKRAVAELKEVGIPTPELDVKVLICASLDKDSVFLLTHPENLLTNREYSKFRRYIRRRKALEPIAYILGHKEFYGHDFRVNKNVLVPRPETEFLVEESLDRIMNNESRIMNKKLMIRNSKFTILDMGTGSGCIIVSIAKALQEIGKLNSNIKLYASDISKQALSVAKKNAKLLGVNKNIRFYLSDIFSNNRLPKKYDIVVANLPYVPMSTKKSEKSPIDFEPQDAIFAKNNGCEIVFRFLDNFRTQILARYLLLELDSRNIKSVEKYSKNIFKDAQIEIKKDLAGKARYLFIKTK